MVTPFFPVALLIVFSNYYTYYASFSFKKNQNYLKQAVIYTSGYKVKKRL